jgi:cobalamin biosynthesis protein CbiG
MTLGIDAVAEPCALLGGSKTELILEKQIYNKITIAIAAERLEW